MVIWAQVILDNPVIYFNNLKQMAMVQNYWTPKNRPANTKFAKYHHVCRIFVWGVPEFFTQLAMFMPTHRAPRSRNVLGIVPPYLPWRQPIFPWLTGLQIFRLQGGISFPSCWLIQKSTKVAPVDWPKTKNDHVYVFKLMEHSTPTCSNQNATPWNPTSSHQDRLSPVGGVP